MATEKPEKIAAVESEDFVAGEGLILNDVQPVLCVGATDKKVLVRAGRVHMKPMAVLKRKLRMPTHAEISEHEDVYARLARYAADKGELGE